jgi:DNA invertase Pin-like site-specific DNA recombinase
MSRKQIPAVAYLRTSSATNAGPDKDSDKRQRAAIAAFAKAHGYVIIAEFYDAAVSGADPIADRRGFKAMLDRIAGNGVRCILVESPDRFARDLTVQLTGHDYLRSLGVELVPTSAPDFFTTDTPTAVLVRQDAPVMASTNGTERGLSDLRIRQHAEWYSERAFATPQPPSPQAMDTIPLWGGNTVP